MVLGNTDTVVTFLQDHPMLTTGDLHWLSDFTLTVTRGRHGEMVGPLSAGATLLGLVPVSLQVAIDLEGTPSAALQFNVPNTNHFQITANIQESGGYLWFTGQFD